MKDPKRIPWTWVVDARRLDPVTGQRGDAVALAQVWSERDEPVLPCILIHPDQLPRIADMLTTGVRDGDGRLIPGAALDGFAGFLLQCPIVVDDEE